jgi:hypothetical protein
MQVYVCLFVLVHLRFALRLDRDLFPRFEESTIKRWRPSDQALWVPRDWRPWASVWWRQVSSDLLCPIYFIIHCPAYYEQHKDWLALYLPGPWLPFGLLWLDSCYCFTLINEHDEDYQWYDVSLLYYDTILVVFKGARAVSRVPLRKDLFVRWPPGKTVQPWGWNGMPLAE